MTARAKKRRTKRRSRYGDAATAAGQEAQRQEAFAAIRRLYCESLPLWRACRRGHCRRRRRCAGDGTACLPRIWPLMPPELQQRAYELVRRGGPRRLRPATQREWELRGYPPTNFVV